MTVYVISASDGRHDWDVVCGNWDRFQKEFRKELELLWNTTNVNRDHDCCLRSFKECMKDFDYDGPSGSKLCYTEREVLE